jgi:D-lactate dehydrogenase (cytochrome)
MTARTARRAVAPRDTRRDAVPAITRDPGVVSSFLSDAAHVAGGFAAGVAFPEDEADVSALMSRALRVLAVGAQSSLTGGATPHGEVILSTRALTGLEVETSDRVSVGAGVPLATLQRTLSAQGLYYPPVPTYDGAFVGGTVATNAAGAATFKYGSTRRWVDGLTAVLASGDVLDISRGECIAGPSGEFEIALPSGDIRRLRVPSYTMPDVAKLSAGYHAAPGMDLVDLFIGSEGTLAVIVGVRLNVIRRPRRCVALVRCGDDHQAIGLTAVLRREAADAWRNDGPLDVAAVEYVDARALRVVPDEAFARAGVTRPAPDAVMVLVQMELTDDEHATLGRFEEVLRSCGVAEDPILAAPDDDRAAQRLFDLREAVPASVNAAVAVAKARAHPGIEKTAGDFVVPFDRIEASIAGYREAFERRGLNYAIWGHLSDGNLHPNLIPESLSDVASGREAILESGRRVIEMGGAPLAEHGVGRSALKQLLLRELYGEAGIEQMRAVKRALDPDWKLAPGVLFPAVG